MSAVVKMFFMAIRKPSRGLSPSLLCRLLPNAYTPTSVSSIEPSTPQNTSSGRTDSANVSRVGTQLHNATQRSDHVQCTELKRRVV